jgi:hypothetical protein
MNLERSERFDADVERQLRWYLTDAGLDPLVGQEVAERFADSVERTLGFIADNPEVGRPRFTRRGFVSSEAESSRGF